METQDQSILSRPKIARHAITSLAMGLLAVSVLVVKYIITKLVEVLFMFPPSNYITYTYLNFVAEFIFQTLAIIFGILALKQIKKEHLRGKALAIIGVTVAILSFIGPPLVSILFILLILVVHTMYP